MVDEKAVAEKQRKLREAMHNGECSKVLDSLAVEPENNFDAYKDKHFSFGGGKSKYADVLFDLFD